MRHALCESCIVFIVQIWDYANDGGERQGDGPDDDNKDGILDAIVSVGGYDARLSFFAFADDNHMPIRRVMVDWADEEGALPLNHDIYGLYYNRKPYCSHDDDGSGIGECEYGSPISYKTNLTCQDVVDCQIINSTWRCAVDTATGGGKVAEEYIPSFANSPRACKEDYFTFYHYYGCGDRELQDNSMIVRDLQGEEHGDAYARLLAMGVKPEDKVCVFKPRVQVLDNWGWCNGTCPDEPGGVGCYDGGDLTPPDVDECSSERNYESAPGPWTEYKGEIIVIPSN